jgi:putative salt-induced outer membrane protein YdiY
VDILGGMMRALAVTATLLALATTARAQDCPCPPPPPPPPDWTISLGGGLSLTRGNDEASSYNLLANIVHDPRRKNVVRFEALYLRTHQEGVDPIARTTAKLRDEYAVSGRLYVFGELGYFRDLGKDVEYLISPMVGGGYRLIDRKTLLLAADAGVGAAFEKLSDVDGTTDFAVQASERFEWQATPIVKLIEKATALWKADDLGDAYYHAEAGLAATLAKRLELKLALVDDYKTRPPPGLEKNDISFVASLVFKP